MKKHTFIWGTIILAIGGFLAKIIGAFYKIPLTNILGSSGMGLYYLVFPIYNLFLVVSSSGVSIAITRLVAQSRVEKNKKNETTYFLAGVFISLILSLLFSTFVFICAKPLAYAQGNVLSYMSFLAIAPSIVFASIISIIKAYFQGIENMFPTSLAIIFEQIVKLVTGLLLSYRFINLGIEYAVMGSVLAISISEALTLIIMLFNYAWHKKHNDNKFYINNCKRELEELIPKIKILKRFDNLKIKKIKRKKIYYIIKRQNHINFFTAANQTFKMMIPNTLMNLVTPLITLIDSFLIINLLTKSGYSSFTATSLYGINNGIVTSLISLPVIITSAISTSIVPNLSGLVCLKKHTEINSRCSFFLKITWIIMLPIFLYFLIMSKEIVACLYNFNNVVINEYGFACKILKISSISIIYNSLLSTFISLLQAINKPYKVFFVLLSGLIIRISILLFLLQYININIFGVVFANIIFQLYCCLLCLIIIKKYIMLDINVFKSFFIPSFIVGIVGLCLFFIKNHMVNFNMWLILVVCGVVLITMYLLLIILFKCFDKSDSKYLPILNKIYKQK